MSRYKNIKQNWRSVISVTNKEETDSSGWFDDCRHSLSLVRIGSLLLSPTAELYKDNHENR